MANEVRNARLRTETQSALLGGDNPELNDNEGTTGYGGATPSKNVAATPNPMATPLRQSNGVANTAVPLRTPRDNFRLNDQTPRYTAGQTPRELKLAQNAAKSSLKAKLGSLPAPQQAEFDLELPEDEAEPSGVLSQIQEEDAAARDAKIAAIRAEKERQEFKRQTQVVQRGLPRPRQIEDNALNSIEENAENAEQMVIREAAVLAANDASNRPNQRFDDEDMKRARMEVALELSLLDAKDDKIRALADAWDDTHANTMYDGSQYDEVDEAMTRIAVDANGAEKKLAKHLGGYQARSKTLREKIIEANEALERARIDLETKYIAQSNEEAAIQGRLEQQRDEVQTVLRRERAAQESYRDVRAELEGLQTVNGHRS